MRSILKSGAPVVAALALSQQAQAHGFAGDHMFISTLLIDDPNVADEASCHFQFCRIRPTRRRDVNTSFEFDKRITENFGFSISDGYTWLPARRREDADGWNNLVVSLKYKPYVNAEHEFMLSVGVEQQIPRTGATGMNGALGQRRHRGYFAEHLFRQRLRRCARRLPEAPRA